MPSTAAGDRVGQHAVPPPAGGVRDDGATVLPMPPTPLVGREAEVAAVCALLGRADVRLVTLTGPGGVGKTRLALHVAGLLADTFARDVHAVALVPVADPAGVLPAIAEALSLPELGDTASPGHLARAVGPRRLLLVLDNFEHVAAAAPLVAELLGACPGLSVLATSRSPLHLRAEQEVPLGPLTVPALDQAWSVADLERVAAVELFLQRARAVRPDFALSAENAAAVAEVCVHLDGLPLAIELAAARVRILSPQAVLSRLEHRLALLTGGALDLPPRLRTMRDAIAWSYELLTGDERALFRRLAVFVGGCTLEAAAAVAAEGDEGDLEVLDAVAALVDKSLVVRKDGAEGEPRFGMLETIREFGLEQLDAGGEVAETRERHAAFFLALAEPSAAGPEGQDAETRFAQLATEHDNLRAALAWYEQRGDADAGLRLAGALVRFWYSRSHRAEGCRWVERLLAVGDAAPPVRAKALLGLGILASGARSDERAVPPLRDSLALWRELGDAASTAETLIMLGIKLENLGAYSEAVPLLDEAAALFEGLGLDAWAAVAHHHRGVLAYGLGDLAGAESTIADAVARHRRLGDGGTAPGWVASALNDLGVVVGARGDLARAAALHAESLDRWRRAGTREGIADALANLASIAAAAGQPEQAAQLFGAAAALAGALGYAFELPERTAHERAVAGLMATMGDAAYAAAWHAGRGLSLDQAVKEAAAVRPDLIAPSPSLDAGSPEPPGAGLSPRETEVLRLLVAGASNREIATALFISPRTVQAHLTNIFGKLGVGTRSAAVAHAFQHRLV